MQLQGLERTYRFYKPQTVSAKYMPPLVIVLHGAYGQSKTMMGHTGFNDLADREGFIVAYPDGIGIFGLLQHWNAGHCCAKAVEENVDDVVFLKKVIEDAIDRFKADEDRVYMVGFSNGGMMTYRFAAENGDLLAAAAPLAASIGGRPSEEVPIWRIPEPKTPLPILTLHGLLDEHIPFAGGKDKKGSREYLSVKTSIDFWVTFNKCHPRSTVENIFNGSVQLKKWEQCDRPNPVWLYLLEGWGHEWPGKKSTAKLKEDHPLKNFDTARIVWDFFKRFKRPLKSATQP
jgi:polyhydroxybutyrate depolymerase